MDWQLTIMSHWPHDRFALGWEFLPITEQAPYNTVQIFLLVITIRLDFVSED